MTYEIMTCSMAHIQEVCRTIRAEDRAEIEGMGFRVHRALRYLYRTSEPKRAALVDGDVAAIWGVQGGFMDEVGMPWLFTCPPVERAKLAFLKETRREVAELLETRRVLRTHVLASYTRSIRLFESLGFVFSAPASAITGGPAFRQMTKERT